VVWANRPTARRISELYPQRPLREGLGGRVALNCQVLANLNVSCDVATESPAGQGFGRAALAASSSYRARPTLSDGSSAVGARARIIVSFQAPQ
jgi:protein TonB